MLAQRGFFSPYPVDQTSSFARCSSWWERTECCGVLSVPTPPVLTYYSTLVVSCRPGPDAVWHVAALQLVAMSLMRILFAAEHGVFEFFCDDPQMG